MAEALDSGELEANTDDGTGLSLLGLVAQWDNVEAVRLLVEELKADPRRADGRGLLPIQHALLAGSAKCAEYLLTHSPDVEDADNSFRGSLLHFAAQAEENAAQLVKLLVAKGANVNARDVEGVTPLIFAASRGDAETVAALVAAGADASVQTAQGGARDFIEEFPQLEAALAGKLVAKKSPPPPPSAPPTPKKTKAKAKAGRHLSPPYRAQWDASILKAAEDDVAGALADIEALARELPDEPDLHRSLANLYDRSGDGPRALKSIERAVALNPEVRSALTHVRLLLIHGPAVAVGAAMRTLEAAVNDDETRAEFLAYAAIVAARDDKIAQAAVLAARARSLDEYLTLDDALEDEFEDLA